MLKTKSNPHGFGTGQETQQETLRYRQHTYVIAKYGNMHLSTYVRRDEKKNVVRCDQDECYTKWLSCDPMIIDYRHTHTHTHKHAVVERNHPNVNNKFEPSTHELAIMILTVTQYSAKLSPKNRLKSRFVTDSKDLPISDTNIHCIVPASYCHVTTTARACTVSSEPCDAPLCYRVC
jgi:hypothetical protein